MHYGEHHDRPGWTFYLSPGTVPTGHRPANPSAGQAIKETSGRVLRWSDAGWLDDLPEWLLYQCVRDYRDAGEPAELKPVLDEVWELHQSIRHTPPGLAEENDAMRRLRVTAQNYSSRAGW